ncbi:MAG: hypothetical protein A3C93_03940 [Candidatus Lloydbacteria bacterium RIFCSPHIGHO2_02_FULL_54_17]|uniref:VWFA domain-containing protein n=1 Tax=Candidatus Lloydbacteria bacterium RIFCSPHIGHO2_02_FULL_54_17 TaxID=1798664 RepID=A0A1G2DFE5_9BACT|nr:MAG: hypothetical protein A2762_03475 [Candidatus Lloydbacteria bacterium RIFCSPHIGHO2_01_FULL_54_11]OGZ12263.1 MAG: hypothetical protein A3C93_03940 [Candidatus Lloydbacteria bacterium RIFCSPHIGHO2_02_FULL_54_17]OGZ13966.1 MAG: hypothetical protein A2948_00590 [Candidatus Lloydbacteria bacterium RIFCSPLOWO2_01_FULL_54_18]OGZ16428.1 MAG: hypothetical protein A3H76_05390 [Candidatus Lloydbacteria bacterium RIFCSPLOWO2_02_FULL_54_12]
MSESGDYTPAPYWSDHKSFKTARAHYDTKAARSYDDAVSDGKTLKDLIPASVTTESSAPLVIVTDETGSMGEWPAVIFSKLPYLEHEAKEYLGDDVEISFAAIGDAHTGSEKFWLQVRPFAKKKAIKTELEKLVIEGAGGGQVSETYEMAALYYARKCEMPKAIKPIIIFIGDEKPYDMIAKEHAKMVGVSGESRIATKDVFEELKRKFSVYLILKPYEGGSSNTMGSVNRGIRAAWAELVGEDHIADLPSADRVVDVIFGILAKETAKVPYFVEELKDRQLKDKGGAAKVETVMKSLKTIHAALPAPDTKKGAGSGKSQLHTTKKSGGATKRLVD